MSSRDPRFGDGTLKVVSRTNEIRGDRTPENLHSAVFDAFDREGEHLYEFQVGGKGPQDPETRRYVLPGAMEEPVPARGPDPLVSLE